MLTFFLQTTFIHANTLQLFGIIPCSYFSPGYTLLSHLQYSTVRPFSSAAAFSRLTFHAEISVLIYQLNGSFF